MEKPDNRDVQKAAYIENFIPEGSRSWLFFEQKGKEFGFEIKANTIKQITLLLLKEHDIKFPSSFYRDKKAACKTLDDYWDVIKGDLASLRIDVEYKDPNKKRKSPKRYRCWLLGKYYELDHTGSFGKVCEHRQPKTNHNDVMERIHLREEISAYHSNSPTLSSVSQMTPEILTPETEVSEQDPSEDEDPPQTTTEQTDNPCQTSEQDQDPLKLLDSFDDLIDDQIEFESDDPNDELDF